MAEQQKQKSNGESVKLAKRSQGSCANDPKLDRRRVIMVAMWARMSTYFGSLWESQYGDVNDQSIYGWQGALWPLSENQIAVGIKACQDWKDKFPPTFGQFKALCLSGPSEDKATLKLEREVDAAVLNLVAARELIRQANILADNCDESREQSMEKLGLNRRWS